MNKKNLYCLFSIEKQIWKLPENLACCFPIASKNVRSEISGNGGKMPKNSLGPSINYVSRVSQMLILLHKLM